MGYVIYCDGVEIAFFKWQMERDVCWRALMKAWPDGRYRRGISREVKRS